jgi:hypothetical protein
MKKFRLKWLAVGGGVLAVAVMVAGGFHTGKNMALRDNAASASTR